MASLDSLPADQRAVLQLILQRGRSYDDIAQLLSIDRAAVRQRALSAFDALGPQTRVEPERRSLITDYLLSQLPEKVAEQTRQRLAESSAERAWARVLSSELGQLAAKPLPEIPAEAAAVTERAAPEPVAPRPAAPVSAAPVSEPAAAEPAPAATRTPERIRETVPPPLPPDRGQPPRSRLGGALLLGGGAVIAVVVVLVIVLSSGSSNKKSTSTTAASHSTTTSTGGSRTQPKVVAQINLLSPTHAKAAGVAEILKQGNNTGIAIVAQGLPANSKHDAYAVWLYNGPSDSHILGFVNPGVGSNGRLSTAGALPTTAARFKQLIVTLETQARPKAPGSIVLQGALTGL
jgi:hypothetical protein